MPSAIRVLVVDDGSTDRTSEIVLGAPAAAPGTREAGQDGPWNGAWLDLLSIAHGGKGAAVRAGVLAADGDYVIFADADMATPPHEIPKLLAALRTHDVALGSRIQTDGSDMRQTQPLFRRMLGRLFHRLAAWWVAGPVRDTQCGFKGFRRTASIDLFERQRIMSIVFDVELIYLARNRGYRVAVVPIQWFDRRGSRMRIGPRLALQVAFDLGQSPSSTETTRSVSTTTSWLRGVGVRDVAPSMLVAVVLLLPGALDVAGPYLDAAVFSDVGASIRNGGVLYVDAWDHKPPGIFLVDAASQAVLPFLPSWGAAWVASVIFTGITLLLVGVVLRANGGDRGIWLSLCAAAVCLTVYPVAVGGGLAEVPALAFAMAAFVSVQRSGVRLRNVLVAGVFAGCACMVNPQAASATLAILYLVLEGRTNRGRLAAAAAFAIGLAVVGWLNVGVAGGRWGTYRPRSMQWLPTTESTFGSIARISICH